GPLNVTIIRKASHAQKRQAYHVALGGALVDTLICGGIGLGFGWLLERVVQERWVKAALALFIAAYGLKILLVDRRRDAEREAESDEYATGVRPRPPAKKGRLPVL